MNILKVILASGLLAHSCVMAACLPNADRASFMTFRDAFIAASLQGKAEQVAPFYQFPVTAGGPTEEDRVIRISRKTFLKHYADIFVRSPDGPTRLYRELSAAKTIHPTVLSRNFGPDGCVTAFSLPRGFGEHNYEYRLVDGEWKVILVELSDHYDSVISMLKHKGIKPW